MCSFLSKELGWQPPDQFSQSRFLPVQAKELLLPACVRLLGNTRGERVRMEQRWLQPGVGAGWFSPQTLKHTHRSEREREREHP